MIFSKIAERIEELRKMRGLTQADFAFQIGLSQPKTRGRSMVNNWEQGTAIRSDIVATIVDVFGVSPSWLFGYSDCPSTNEDIQITHKTTGLSETAIQNLRRCDTESISALLECEAFIAPFEDRSRK